MKKSQTGSRSLLTMAVVLGAVLVILFYKSFSPQQALFSNDGPLGAQLSRPLSMPQAFFGIWNDNYWIGAYNGNYNPNFSGLIYFICQPKSLNGAEPGKDKTTGLARVNFYTPLSVFILGLCAWVFFRRLGCNSRVAILASLSAALNMNYFSNACWGLGSRDLSLGAAFLALAAVEAAFIVQPRAWHIVNTLLTAALAGLAIGLSITEGGDNGAILAMFVGTYAIWRTIVTAPSAGAGAAIGIGKVVVMIVFAAVMASQTLNVFVRTAVKGVVGTEQDSQSKQQKWDFATQWSLPKLETLRVIIPGLFGYRMDTPEGGNYWGRVGEAPGAAQQMPRYSGAGEYTGILVVLISIWAIAEALRKKGQIFTTAERKLIWFWAVMGFVALLLSWGRHAPFYRVVYALPYFSTIRNPMKFMHAFNLCAMILFAYGLMGLSRRYLEGPDSKLAFFDHLKAWWQTGRGFEKLWTWGCIAFVALGAVACLGMAGSRSAIVKHLTSVGFPDETMATQMAKFSTHEVLLFVVFLGLSVFVVTAILSGAFSGDRARVAGLLLGLILVVDLARVDLPWIVYYDWKDKYATNPVIDALRDKPYEHRVTMPQFQLNQQFSLLQQVYHVEWLQHHFPFYDVESIDVPQEPRVPADKEAFRTALSKNLPRLWQLTNTRYLFGLAGGFVDALNQQLDPAQKRFRERMPFKLFQKPGSQSIGAETNSEGPFALVEFTGALPRAKLYSSWEIIPEEKALLTRLGDPAWDPMQTALVMAGDAPKPSGTNVATSAGQAVITSNPSTKTMIIKTESPAAGMLLVNDKIEPEWHAYIDGSEAKVLRANYLMRAVHVPAGTHTVTFRYQLNPTGFYVVLACDLAGLALLAAVIFIRRRARPEEIARTPSTAAPRQT